MKATISTKFAKTLVDTFKTITLKKSLTVLSNFCITKESIYVTDLKTFAILPNKEHLPEGVSSFVQLKELEGISKKLKTSNFEIQIDADDEKEYPSLSEWLSNYMVETMRISYANVDWKELNTYASDDELRYYISGINFGKEEFVATDGRRLITVKHNGIEALNGTTPNTEEYLFDFSKVQPESSGVLTVGCFEDCRKWVKFEKGEATYYVLCGNDFRFPNYQRVIPNYGHEAKTIELKFADCLKLASDIKIQKSKRKIALVSENGSMSLLPDDQQFVDNDSWVFALNGQYIFDFFSHNTPDMLLPNKLVFQYVAKNKAVVNIQENKTIIIMPCLTDRA